MKTKGELITAIEKIPTFKMVEIATKEESEYREDTHHKAIIEQGGALIYSTVSNGYKLVQFKDVYLPVLEDFPQIEGYVRYYGGFGWLVIFPQQEDFRTGEYSVGIMLRNSVEKSSAINIEFCIKYDDKTIMLPDNRRLNVRHFGKTKELLKNYQSFVLQVKNEWVTILNKLQAKELDDTEVDALLKEMRITKKVREAIKAELTSFNLWDILISMINAVTTKKYRDDINQMRKIKKISQICIDYAMMAKI